MTNPKILPEELHSAITDIVDEKVYAILSLQGIHGVETGYEEEAYNREYSRIMLQVFQQLMPKTEIQIKFFEGSMVDTSRITSNGQFYSSFHAN